MIVFDDELVAFGSIWHGGTTQFDENVFDDG
jgi:hypothetical protein